MDHFAPNGYRVFLILTICWMCSDIVAGATLRININLPGQGRIQGSTIKTAWSNQTVYQFLGIPFAESPSGDLRFRAPVPRKPWPHVHDGSQYGRRCPVITSVSKLSPEEIKEDLEDCLNLCVFTKDVSKKRPVMFYVYGGGFYNGSASDHPPRYLLEKDIVLVVIQYRIGAVGWLSTKTEEMPGNSPVLDVITALEWVHSYIEHFGGNAKELTLVGQSAGAAVSGLLMLSPKIKQGLFKRVILQSGSALPSWAVNRNPLQLTEKICRRFNCTRCEEPTGIYKCLRSFHIADILQATEQDNFSPSLDDFHGILPVPPEELMNRDLPSYPLMTGVTKHDGSFILADVYDATKRSVGNITKAFSPREFASLLYDVQNHPDFADLTYNALMTLLFNATDLDGGDHKKLIPGYIDLGGDVSIKSPVFTFARKNSKKSPTYVYTFDYEGKHTRFGYELGNEHYPFNGGVHHSNDNIYLFSTHDLNEEDTSVAKTMVDLWTSFVITGTPSTQSGVAIYPLNAKFSGPYFHIDKDVTIDHDYYKELKAAISDPNRDALIRPNVDF